MLCLCQDPQKWDACLPACFIYFHVANAWPTSYLIIKCIGGVTGKDSAQDPTGLMTLCRIYGVSASYTDCFLGNGRTVWQSHWARKRQKQSLLLALLILTVWHWDLGLGVWTSPCAGVWGKAEEAEATVGSQGPCMSPLQSLLDLLFHNLTRLLNHYTIC